MGAVRTALVDRFAADASADSLAHSHLVVSRDIVSLEATARMVLQAIDGANRLSLADALVVEPEGTSIGIDAARAVREHLAVFPGTAPYRTALVLRAELLTPEAQNALLKVAEEPAERSVLLLAAADEARLLPTLRSRLQRHALPPLAEEQVAAWLAGQGSDTEAAARSGGSLSLAAELAEGGPAQEAARALLNAKGAQVAAIAKEAATAEIPLRDLLRALSTELAYTDRTPRDRELWHRVQRLTAASETSPLSLRIQVAALFADLPA